MDLRRRRVVQRNVWVVQWWIPGSHRIALVFWPSKFSYLFWLPSLRVPFWNDLIVATQASITLYTKEPSIHAVLSFTYDLNVFLCRLAKILQGSDIVIALRGGVYWNLTAIPCAREPLPRLALRFIKNVEKVFIAIEGKKRAAKVPCSFYHTPSYTYGHKQSWLPISNTQQLRFETHTPFLESSSTGNLL